jgi:hypothetical protein
MKKIFENLKDPISDLFGLAIMILTASEVYFQEIEWVWEGLIGVGVGAIFFLLPDEFIHKIIEKVTDKLLK